ncbi:solute carrier family 35, member C2 [Entomortierella parvispora]|uniref:Solute carrier family 35, member C2 n=1 Tax=Entomortierella parvispora TaxID=205924 RepID=A0A9P3HBX1_9FUNG|nr:solute carrier family 35, member C2 [Entomortierella parvispora]
MREPRETTLARRLSMQTPKPSPSPPHHTLPSTPHQPANSTINHLSNSPSGAHASPDRNYKRASLPAYSQPPPILDPTATRKKNDVELEDDFPFQRNILANNAHHNNHNASSYPPSPVSAQHPGSGTQAGASFSSSSASVGSGPMSISSSLPPTLPTSSSIGANSSAFSGALPPLPQRTSSGGGNHGSVHGTRTALGSVLASSFGGVSSSLQSSKFTAADSVPPTRKGSLMMNDTISIKSGTTTVSGSTASNSTTTTATGTPILSSLSSGGNHGNNNSGSSSNGSGGFPSYTPDVFINIGRTSASLPQILMPKKRVARDIASNLSYIAAWYFFSTALSIYNKNLMGKDNWNFNLPLFVSSVHAGLHFVITACLMHFWPEVFDATRSGKGGRLTIHSYVTQVVPCAIAAALEICMANASLMYITLSFYTMIKSSTPIWVLFFAFAFGLEKPRMSLILIIGVIVVGVILTVAGETQFDMTGFMLVLLAAVMSGLRWSLTQMLLQKDQLGMDNPVATLYYISPIMFVIMSILSLVIEDPFVAFASSDFFLDFRTGMLTMLMACGGGLLAFAMTVAEFKLIKNTGTVTLSVAGISKEIVVISLSMLIFGDRLTFVNLLGLLVSIGGIMAYNYIKIRKMQQSHGDYEPLGPRHHKGDNTD